MSFDPNNITRFLGPNVVVFDTETNSPHAKELRLTVAVAWSSVTNQYHVFWEKDLAWLALLLDSATTIVAHNSRFDIGVMQEYFGEAKAATWWPKVFDLFELIKNREGTWIGINALAIANNKTVKIGDGLGAIVLWNEQKLEELALYCCYDVKILCELLATPKLQYCISRYQTDIKMQRHCGWGVVHMDQNARLEIHSTPSAFAPGTTAETCACSLIPKLKREAEEADRKRKAATECGD